MPLKCVKKRLIYGINKILSDAVSCVDHLGDLTKHPPERWNSISESNAE